MTELSQLTPDEITRGLFSSGRRVVRTHPLATDALVAAMLLALSSVWLAGSPFAGPRAAIVQTVLIAVIAARRVWPAAVFLAASAIALAQWVLGFPLLGDAALLVALYTVAAHASRTRALLAAGLLEVGAVMAAVKWDPAGTPQRSLIFLTATVVAALFTGLTAASGSRYLAWMDERARRLEIERDQQAEIAASAERTRIARELHDIVSHSLSVVITLADAAAIVGRADPGQGADAMAEVSEAGRRALADMRAMLGVLRTDESPSALAPQPGVAELGALVDRVRATGLSAALVAEGTPFSLGGAAELTVYRIVQESLTNTLRHAGAGRVQVTIGYADPEVTVRVTDDGAAAVRTPGRSAGHGLDGMRERVALHGGTLRAGPVTAGGWVVEAIFRPGQPSTRAGVAA
ncbi:MAG: sensor histidine kinase [Actinomycetota bacterium]|nr:sensor histidine kinase [Actinomycetota bacterium]